MRKLVFTEKVDAKTREDHLYIFSTEPGSSTLVHSNHITVGKFAFKIMDRVLDCLTERLKSLILME
jgi:hypothetical protein